MYMIHGLEAKHFSRNIGNHSSIDTALRRSGLSQESRQKVSEHLFNTTDPKLKRIIGKEGIHSGNLHEVMEHLKKNSDIGFSDREFTHLQRGLEDRIHTVVEPPHAANDNMPHVHDRAA